MLKLLHTIGTTLRDTFLPPSCLMCRTPTDADHVVCANCWPKLHFLSAPQCMVCAIPFMTTALPEMTCPRCLKDPPEYTRAFAALVYDDNSRKLVLGLKHGDQTHLAPGLAHWLLRTLTPARDEIDAIIPVPLAYSRLVKRRFNQAALIAQTVSRELQKPLLLQSLLRTRATPSQGNLHFKERQLNVKKAFALKDTTSVKDKTILLVDDVLTTGATVNACSTALRAAGAKKIYIGALARVPDPSHIM